MHSCGTSTVVVPSCIGGTRLGARRRISTVRAKAINRFNGSYRFVDAYMNRTNNFGPPPANTLFTAITAQWSGCRICSTRHPGARYGDKN